MEYYLAFLSIGTIVFISLLVCAALACIPAGIARDKGHPFGIWWFYGLLLFPFALIHSSLIPPAGGSVSLVPSQVYMGDSCVESYSSELYDGPSVSAWGYVGLTFLWFIPVIGWLCWLFTAIFSKNLSKRNYARSYFCNFILLLVIVILVVVVLGVLVATGIITQDTINGLIGQQTA